MAANSSHNLKQGRPANGAGDWTRQRNSLSVNEPTKS